LTTPSVSAITFGLADKQPHCCRVESKTAEILDVVVGAPPRRQYDQDALDADHRLALGGRSRIVEIHDVGCHFHRRARWIEATADLQGQRVTLTAREAGLYRRPIGNAGNQRILVVACSAMSSIEPSGPVTDPKRKLSRAFQ
jgi:hypothetical protein